LLRLALCYIRANPLKFFAIMNQMLEQLGRYEILAEIGRGAMGTVFQARDPKIDRVVAIKTISVPETGEAEMEQYRQRFFREAQAAGRLSAPGIVTIYDVGEDEATRTPFIVMEYVPGRTLDQVVEAAAPGRLARGTALHLIQQVAEALDYAHSHGIVHRDIKPSNIIVTEEGHAKIADFGIARLSLGEVTMSGQVLGTPAYMSPEQLHGKPIDGRSDLFSLGVIAYWLLTGQKPFTGDSLTAISVQVLSKDPAPPTVLDSSLSPGFDQVFSRALAKDPDQRYPRCRDFSLDLQDVSAGRPPRFRPTPADRTQALKAPQPIAASQQPVPNAGGPSFLSRMTAYMPEKFRRPVVLYPALALIVVAGLALVAASNSRAKIISPPANLQIIGQYSFRAAEISVWVDNDLRYQGQVTGALRKHTRLFKTTYTVEGRIALTIPLRAGNHKIRFHVKVPGEAYDEDSTIEGQFNPYSEKTLRAIFSDQGLDLNWVL